MMETIVKAIPVIIMAGILLFVVAQYIEFGGKAVDRESCRDSVLLKERSKILGKPLISDVKCKTHVVEIDSTEKEEIFEDISNEMYDCWKQFGEGKRDFLDKHDFGRGDNWCFVCSRIDFDEETQNEFGSVTNENLNDFLDYLRDEPIPFEEDLNFFEYFYGDANVGAGANLELDLSEPLYVAFLGDKRVDHYAQAKEGSIATVLGTTGGCLIGGALGLLGGPFAPATVSAGCLGGAQIGFATAALFVGYQETSVKHGYVSSLYVGDAEGTIDFCNV